jgi:hypothetical protein
MEDVVIFYGHLNYFTALRYILWQIEIVCGCLVYFSHFGMFYQEKSGNPDLKGLLFRYFAFIFHPA